MLQNLTVFNQTQKILQQNFYTEEKLEVVLLFTHKKSVKNKVKCTIFK